MFGDMFDVVDDEFLMDLLGIDDIDEIQGLDREDFLGAAKEKAKRCMELAEAMLPNASSFEVEDQAFDLIKLPEEDLEKFEYKHGLLDYKHTETCPDCGGKGKYIGFSKVEDPCQRCKGDGKIYG